MTERQAAVKANQIYALWATLGYDDRKANAVAFWRALDKLVPYMSGAQLIKFYDFDYAINHNYR